MILNVKTSPALKGIPSQSKVGAGIFNGVVLPFAKMKYICIFFALFIVILQAGLSH